MKAANDNHADGLGNAWSKDELTSLRYTHLADYACGDVESRNIIGMLKAIDTRMNLIGCRPRPSLTLIRSYT